MRLGSTSVLVVVSLVFAVHFPLASADCVETVCHSDETAGDTSTPCEDGTAHASRYRYKNASATFGNHDVRATLTFTCESNPPRGEWFYGNVTVTDGQRTDEAQVYYYYGWLYSGMTCTARVFVDPDLVKVPGGPGFDGHAGVSPGSLASRNLCPNPEEYPSVVSTLP